MKLIRVILITSFVVSVIELQFIGASLREALLATLGVAVIVGSFTAIFKRDL